MATRVTSIIVAMGKNQVIGKEGKIPWHIKSDMQHFKTITMGHTVIMGRKTAESIGKALPQRLNVIISRNKELFIAGFKTVNSLEEAFEYADKDSEVFIIGGAEIYSLALPYTQKIYVTEVGCEIDGDTFFPLIDPEEWEISGNPERHPKDIENEYDYSFSVIERTDLKN